MARVKLGETVVGLRGTIGGVCFSAAKTGPYARVWSRGGNPRTAGQAAIRGQVARLGTAWQAMSDGERADWDTLAAAPPEEDYDPFGELMLLSGWNWFVRVNTRRQRVGLAVTEDVPSDTPEDQPAGIDVSLEVGDPPTCSLEWTAAEFGATDSVVLHVATQRWNARAVQYAGFAELAAEYNPGDGPLDFAAAYLAKFGDPVAGQRVFYRVWRQRADGVRCIAVTGYEDFV